jgi:hypothetical protein
MAEQIIKRLIDDIDGGEAEETVQFSLDGVPYEIDLSSANAKKVRDSLAPFVEHARKAGGAAAGGRRRRSRAASSRPGHRRGGVRARALINSAPVNGPTPGPRGRRAVRLRRTGNITAPRGSWMRMNALAPGNVFPWDYRVAASAGRASMRKDRAGHAGLCPTAL